MRIQELVNYSEIKNSRNKGQVKISESTVLHAENLQCFEESVEELIVAFRRHKSGQTLQSQIRLLLEEQSDLGLHCLHLFRF